MFRRDDPRLRRTLDQLSHNVESATEHAQENLYSFSQNYINPCFSSIGNACTSCTESCFPNPEQRRRRQRARSRGRPELSFDFYDDWEEDENDALLGWGNSSDDLNRLLAGSGSSQPHRERAMSYGTRRGDNRTRRRSAAQIEESDTNLIPGSNYLGFLERLPWNMGRKALRYRPSAADLQEHPGALRDAGQEQEPLLEESDEEFATPTRKQKHKRNRSLTETSKQSSDSLSSRGDLWPSEDEADAVPLDDEFANILERRTTGDESPSGRSRPRNSKSNSRVSIRTVSSRSTQNLSDRKASSSRRKASTADPPTFSELKAEEEQIREEEEEEVARKRDAAQRLAVQRGLSSGGTSKTTTRSSSPKPEMTDVVSKSPSSSNGTIPFPAFDPPAGPQTPRSELDIRLESRPLEPTPEEDEQTPPPPEPEGEAEFTPAALPRFSSSDASSG